MRALLFAAVMMLTIAGGLRAQRSADHELDNVSAFARLYGVVRYFYPSDAAAALDWNRFIVFGIGRVRAAENAKALETILNSLFAPLGPGIRIGAALPPAANPDGSEGPLVAWRYFGPGFTTPRGPSPYKGRRTNRSESTSATIDGFVTLMQSIPDERQRRRLRGAERLPDHFYRHARHATRRSIAASSDRGDSGYRRRADGRINPRWARHCPGASHRSDPRQMS
jgi:hypothetical protein